MSKHLSDNTEEHQLAQVDRGQALRAALVVAIAAIVGSLVPLAPFLVLPVGPSMWLSLALAAAVLFAVGAYKARVTVGHPARSGLELALIGTVSALVGFGIRVLLRVPGAT
ncbi:MAG: hypothetical protein RLZZ387_602 [Chloroflexota bacterium]|jgi:predicted membrane protein (TIGR00267 family)